MVVLTFIIAVLNICLGFTLAIYLGYAPTEFHEAWKVLGRSRMRVMPESSTPLFSSFPSLPAEAIEESALDSGQKTQDIGIDNLNNSPT